MKRSYDAIANVYDTLAKLFIGEALRQAQVYFLHYIPAGAKVLVVGGGTGWILEEISAVHPQNLWIDYVDVSAKMIQLAKQKKWSKNKVNFINQSIIHFKSCHQYDVIITPFILDNFKEETMRQVFTLLHQTLNKNGVWIHTDFQISHPKVYWQKAILFLMYSFFRAAANIEAAQLPDVASQFNFHNYQLIESKPFLRRFINTSVYKKLISDG